MGITCVFPDRLRVQGVRSGADTAAHGSYIPLGWRHRAQAQQSSTAGPAAADGSEAALSVHLTIVSVGNSQPRFTHHLLVDPGIPGTPSGVAPGMLKRRTQFPIVVGFGRGA